MQRLQWNVSCHDTFGKEDIRHILNCNSGLHVICHVAKQFQGKQPFVLQEHYGTLANPLPSSIFLLSHVTSPRTWLSPCQALYMRNISPAALQPINQALQQPWNEPYAARAGHREKTMVLYTQNLQTSFFLAFTLNLDSNSLKLGSVSRKIKCWLWQGDCKCRGCAFVYLEKEMLWFRWHGKVEMTKHLRQDRGIVPPVTSVLHNN